MRRIEESRARSSFTREPASLEEARRRGCGSHIGFNLKTTNLQKDTPLVTPSDSQRRTSDSETFRYDDSQRKKGIQGYLVALMDERQLDTRTSPLGCDKGREIAGFGLKWAAEGCRLRSFKEKIGRV